MAASPRLGCQSTGAWLSGGGLAPPGPTRNEAVHGGARRAQPLCALGASLRTSAWEGPAREGCVWPPSCAPSGQGPGSPHAGRGPWRSQPGLLPVAPGLTSSPAQPAALPSSSAPRVSPAFRAPKRHGGHRMGGSSSPPPSPPPHRGNLATAVGPRAVARWGHRQGHPIALAAGPRGTSEAPSRTEGWGRPQLWDRSCPPNSQASFWTGFGSRDVAGEEERALPGG